MSLFAPGDPPRGEAARRWLGREKFNRPLPLVAQGTKAAKGRISLQRSTPLQGFLPQPFGLISEHRRQASDNFSPASDPPGKVLSLRTWRLGGSILFILNRPLVCLVVKRAQRTGG